MLGACHRPRAPQSHGETLVPAVCPAGKGPPPPRPPRHSTAADGAGVTDKSPAPWPCQMPGTSVLLSEEKF